MRIFFYVKQFIFFLDFRVFCLALSLTAFQTQSAPFLETSNPYLSNRLVYCANDVIHTFNPQRASRGITVDIIGPQIYNRLVRSDNGETHLVPELATDWTISEDFKEYTFTLRQKVEFHSNNLFKPTRFLNSDDVIFSFERLINPKNPFYSRDYFPYFEAINLKGRIKSLEKLSHDKVKFTLHQSDVAFLSHLASYYSPILSKEYADHLLSLEKTALLDTKPIGTGAFQFSDYLVDEYVKLNRFDSAWQRHAQEVKGFEQVVFELSSSGVGRLAKLLSKECDLLAYPAAGQLEMIESQAELNHLERATFGTAFLAFNTQRAPLNDPNIRAAIAYAINNPRLMRSIYRDSAETASAFLPSFHWAFDPTVQVTHYSPKASKELLNAHGIKQLNLTLRVSSNPQSYNPSPIKMAELIQADLAQVGINVKIVVHDGLKTTSFYDSHPVDLELTGWSAPNSEPDSYFRPVLSCNAVLARTNEAFWCDEKFDALLDSALRTNDLKQRIEFYQQAQQYLFEQLPILPLAYSKNRLIYDNNIKNTDSLTHGSFSFYQLMRTNQ